MQRHNWAKKTIFRLILLSIVLLPFFNDFPLFFGHSIFRSPSIYPLIVSVCILFMVLLFKLRAGRISFKIHNKSIYIFLFLYIVWSLLSGIINFYDILLLRSYNTEGSTVFIKNIFLLLFYSLVLIATSFAMSQNSNKYYLIRKACLYSFVIIVPYFLLEVFSLIFDNNLSNLILSNIEPIFHARASSGDDIVVNKIRGYAFEASYLSLYLAFAFPWLLSYLFQYRMRYKTYIILIMFLFAIVSLTDSRISYIVIITETILYMIIVSCLDRSKTVLAAIFIVLITLSTTLAVNYERFTSASRSLFAFDKTDISNTTRAAGMHAAFLLSLDKPIFGVGIGLSGGYLPDYYPSYAFLNYQTPDWSDQRDENLATPTFAMLPKLAAEVGYVGLGFFCMIWASAIFLVYNKTKFVQKSEMRLDYHGISLVVLLIGMFVGSFGVDGYNFMGYWVGLGMAAAY